MKLPEGIKCNELSSYAPVDTLIMYYVTSRFIFCYTSRTFTLRIILVMMLIVIIFL